MLQFYRVNIVVATIFKIYSQRTIKIDETPIMDVIVARTSLCRFFRCTEDVEGCYVVMDNAGGCNIVDHFTELGSVCESDIFDDY